MEKQGWSLVVASTACTARQAWQGKQGCAQHRCKASLSRSKPQIRPGGQSNPTQARLASTRMILDKVLSLTSPHLHCSQPLYSLVVSHFFNSLCLTGMTAASKATSPPDFDAIETVAALRGATGKPDNETACDSP